MNHLLGRKTLHLPLALSAALAACTGTTGPGPDAAADAPIGTPAIVVQGGGSLVAVAGDVLHLGVAFVSATGTRTPLPSDAVVTWSGPPVVVALPPGNMPALSNLPMTGVAPTAFFLTNSTHYTDAQTAGWLFVMDAGLTPGGSVSVHAHVTVTGLDTDLDVSIPVGAVPAGDATRGQTYFGANCASCHGATGGGGSAPGLNHAAGNVASDPTWNASLFASVTRGDIDNRGVSESTGMPDWLVVTTATGATLTTHDLVDVYAWLGTQQ